MMAEYGIRYYLIPQKLDYGGLSLSDETGPVDLRYLNQQPFLTGGIY